MRKCFLKSISFVLLIILSISCFSACSENKGVLGGGKKGNNSLHANNDGNGETDDIIRVVSPEQNAELTLDNDKIADYYANYSKGYSVRKGYFGMGDIYMMNAPTIEWVCENGRYYQLFVADNPAFKDAEVFLTTKQSLKVENLIPGKRYFWKVRANLTNGEEKTSKTYSFYTKGNVRTITLDGVSNSRDLGGIRNAENKSVKYGLIYRSANLDSVTESGIKEAKRLGIKTDLDLRGGEAPAVSPLGSNVNLIVKNAPCYTGAPSGINGTQEYRDALRDEIKTFAYEENYPILFHCQIGRDRTGTLAMFILAICGVEKEAIIREYELSYFSSIATYDNKTECPDWIDYTCYFLSELCPEYKTLSEQATAYAISLGVTEEEIAAIKRIVLE